MKRIVTQTISYSSDEVISIIKEQLKLTDEEIKINIAMEDQPGDYRATLPLIPVFKGITATKTIKIEEQ